MSIGLSLVPNVKAPTVAFSAVNLTNVHTCPLDSRTFVVAYHDENNDDFSFQIYDTNGTQILAETDVDTTSGGAISYTSVGVSTFNSTTFVLGWYDLADRDVTFAVYNTTGTKLSGPTDASIEAGLSGFSVQVSCFNSTHFVIAWIDGVSSKVVAFAVYDSSSNLKAGPIAVDANVGVGLSHAVSVSTFNSTVFVIGWYDAVDEDATFAVYNSAGILLTGPIDVDAAVAVSMTVSVSALNSTHFVIGWLNRADEDVMFAVYTSVGTLVTGPTDVDMDTYGCSVQVSALNSTAFVISWYETNATKWNLSFATYLSDGTAVAALTRIESWPVAVNDPFRYQSPCSQETGTGIGNDNWIIAYANTTTQAIFRTYYPNGTAWDGVVVSEAPTIGAASGTNWDDTDNCYAQKKTYTASVTYSDPDGFVDIHYCELYLKTGANATRAEFQFHEDDASWSTPAGSTEWTLTGQSNSSSGNDIAVVWGFQAQWDATEESDLDFLFFVVDAGGLWSNSVSDQNFDAVIRLVTSGFTSDDPRINLAGTTTVNGTVYYGDDPGSDVASTSYPPDAEFTQIDIHDSGDNVVGTDNVIVDGYFSTSFAIPNAVQANTYHVYVNLADADGTDQDAVDGDATSVIGDRYKVNAASLLFEDPDGRVNVVTVGVYSCTAQSEYDGHVLGAGDSLSINGYGFVYNGTYWMCDVIEPVPVAVTLNGLLVVSEAGNGITAGNLNGNSAVGVWDNLLVTNLQPVQYLGGGDYKYEAQLEYGFDLALISGGYVNLAYPNGTLLDQVASNATGWVTFIVGQLNSTSGTFNIYGENETLYAITVRGLNQTFAIYYWALSPQDIAGNSLTNTNHNVTLGATIVWNSTATAVYVPPDTYNLTVTWLQDLVVNATINLNVAGDTTTNLNCTCFPYVIGVTRYWTASNATITSSVYASYLLTVQFSCALDSYVLVASYTTLPAYVLNVTYNQTITFASGYLVMPHFGNVTIVASYENWGGLYVKTTDHTMWSVGWASQRLSIVLNGTIGDIGELDVYCASRGAPVTTIGFTVTSYVGGVFIGLYSFTVADATVSLEWTLASSGGPSGPPQAADLFITLAFTFPETVQSGATVDGFLNVSWMGAAKVYIWSVVVDSDYAKEWELQIARLPWTLETLMQNGLARVPVVLYITGALTAGNYSVPCDVTFQTVEGVSKTVRSILTFEVVTPIAQVPSTLVYVFLIGIGLVVTSGLFLGTQKRRKYSQ